MKLAVVGCGCSIATEPVAEISHQWNISQVVEHKIALVCIIAQFTNRLWFDYLPYCTHGV